MHFASYLSALGLFTRKQSNPLIKKGFFTINGKAVTNITHHLQQGDIISREGQELVVKTVVTVLINKPAGYISSDEDEHGRPSYQQLLDGRVYAPLVHIAGRLDVDTEGLILATSDGTINHRIISPKHHLPKTYLVTTRRPLDASQLDELRTGVTLDDGYQTLPAQAIQKDEHLCELILTEGKYHQVKRMLIAVGNEVIHLQRTALGPWTLQDLDGKRFHELSPEEVALALDHKIST